jgi:hypothetical protein
MGWRAFIAGLALSLPVSFGASSAFADVVYLSCSGTMANLVKRSHEKVGPIPMAVDAEKGIVSLGGYSPFPILKDGRQNFISFAGGTPHRHASRRRGIAQRIPDRGRDLRW